MTTWNRTRGILRYFADWIEAQIAMIGDHVMASRWGRRQDLLFSAELTPSARRVLLFQNKVRYCCSQSPELLFQNKVRNCCSETTLGTAEINVFKKFTYVIYKKLLLHLTIIIYWSLSYLSCNCNTSYIGLLYNWYFTHTHTHTHTHIYIYISHKIHIVYGHAVL